ncbi:MAG: hypothetical protein WD810_05965 [Solirubrobacterales bacterium]
MGVPGEPMKAKLTDRPFSDPAWVFERGEELFREACAKGWEGLIAKRADSTYVHARSGNWLKLKCPQEQELVIGGYTPPKGSRRRFGALLVGYHEGGELLRVSLRPRRPAAAAHWVEPRLVGQFAFTEWTRDGKLRHPRYLGLRDDKPAAEVVRELAGGPP